MAKEMLRFEHVTLGYGERDVIKDFSCSIEEGEFVSLIGPNGSGKSTLVQHLNGLLKPTSGNIIHNDFQICFIANADGSPSFKVNKSRLRMMCNNPRQRRLPYSGRSPENHRRHLIPLQNLPQNLPFPQQMLLPYIIF